MTLKFRIACVDLPRLAETCPNFPSSVALEFRIVCFDLPRFAKPRDLRNPVAVKFRIARFDLPRLAYPRDLPRSVALCLEDCATKMMKKRCLGSTHRYHAFTK